MTDTQTRIDQDYAQSRVAAYTYLKNRIDRIGNDILCDMRTGEDDSVTGFNKALDMVRDLLLEEIGRAAVTAMRDPVSTPTKGE